MRTDGGFSFDPAAVMDDPYPAYAWLREHDPVHLGANGLWYISRHADVFAALHDRRLSSDGRADPVYAARADRVFGGYHTPSAHWFTLHLLRLDGAEHTRVRKVMQAPFLLPNIRRLEAQISDVVVATLRRVRGEKAFDFIAEVARPLPTAVVCRLLGVPRSDWPLCERWTGELTDGLSMLEHDRVAMQRINDSIDAFERYFADLIEERRRSPQDDFLSALAQVDCAAEGIGDEQLLVNATALFVAARETTLGALGNGLLELVRHPDAFAQLRADPSLAPNAVDETLRYQTPLLQVRRNATEPITIDGVTIPEGAGVMVLLGAAHFDHRRYEQPERFDITRPVDGLVSFGFGAHYCIGVHLARREIATAFAQLATLTEEVELDGADLRWTRSPIIRSLETLPVYVRWAAS